eukprot:1249494-Rhodomonas_salina.1
MSRGQGWSKWKPSNMLQRHLSGSRHSMSMQIDARCCAAYPTCTPPQPTLVTSLYALVVFFFFATSVLSDSKTTEGPELAGRGPDLVVCDELVGHADLSDEDGDHADVGQRHLPRTHPPK